ncbi:signal recognition particle subunit [Schizosaccharomyces pombe]|uniref:Signal recognition particle subunit srp68 n=1 Tax=Schizosaccharomyces pombe (strain 972 / ATCC 24843) TaxID=284812 RepID=SRP68_SCHPO
MANFYIFPLLLEARSDHFYEGNEYIKYLSHRIHGLRKSLHITQRGGKPKSSVDKRYAEILLFNADRAFQQFVFLRSSQRRHALRRLKRADQFGKELVSFTNAFDCNDHIFYLEAIAFAKYIEGTLNYEKRDWEGSLSAFSISRLSFLVLQNKIDTLAEHEKSVLGELQNQIDSNLRYVAQRTGLQNQTKSLDILMLSSIPKDEEVIQHVNSVDSEILQMTGDEQDSLQTITVIEWRDQRVKIEHPDVVLALYAIHDVKNSPGTIDSKRDRLLAAWARAEEITKSVLDNTGLEDEQKFQTLSICYTYLAYNVVLLRIQRDLAVENDSELVASQAQLRSRQSLYDSIIKNIEIAKELPGIARDTGMTAQLEAQISLAKSKRCQAIADAYQAQDKLASLAMCVRAASYLQQVNDILRNFEEKPHLIAFDIIPELKKDEKELKKKILLLQSLASMGNINQPPKNLSLVETLDSYQTLAELEPSWNLTDADIRAIPAKPLFFDLAITYLGQQTSFDKKKAQPEKPVTSVSKEPKQKNKGFFSSLLGR